MEDKPKKKIDIEGKEINIDLIIEPAFVSPKIPKSKHVLDLKKKNARNVLATSSRNTFHECHRDIVRIIDVCQPKEILKKLRGNAFIIKEKARAFSFRKKELVRLAAIGITIVFLFNIFNVYYEAKRVQKNVVYSAYEGFSNILSAGVQATQEDFNKANFSFNEALDRFHVAQKELWFLEDASKNVLTRGKASASAQGIISSGNHLAQAGKYFTEAIQDISRLLERDSSVSGLTGSTDSTVLSGSSRSDGTKLQNNTVKSESEKKSMTENLKKDFQLMETALSEIQAAEKALQLVSEDFLPEQIRPKLQNAKLKIATMASMLTSFQTYIPALLKLLGDRYPHRILVLLQNNNEIRPSGGFLGSFMISDMNDGHMQSEFHDVYDFDGQLNEFIPAPKEIQNLTESWKMRDSNYSPDFPTSAQKVAWFLEKENGPGVDSVVAVDLHFAQALLEITGPVTVHGVTFTSENFQMLLSYIVEAKLTGETSPKLILKDFIPEVQKKLMAIKKRSEIIRVFFKEIAGKHIQAFSKDDGVETIFSALRIDGAFFRPKKGEDFLSIIHSSIGGNKSDYFIRQEIIHRSFVQRSGEIVDQVTLKRKHAWNKEEELRLRKMLRDAGFKDLPEGLKNILGGSTNIVGTRWYVPSGSILTDVSGIDLSAVETRFDDDLDLTYFYTVFSVPVGEEREITLNYRLPSRLDVDPIDEYSFHVVKQAGTGDDAFIKELHFTDSLRTFDIVPGFDEVADGYFRYEGILASDLSLAGLIGNR
ncbi:DUF4012 domain-containing protein [Candidatus Peregrinibacteria bacterium]|nr:DUF4012 domain-containing protein [Candidatus Peregrinibacteria bacterium]